MARKRLKFRNGANIISDFWAEMPVAMRQIVEPQGGVDRLPDGSYKIALVYSVGDSSGQGDQNMLVSPNHMELPLKLRDHLSRKIGLTLEKEGGGVNCLMLDADNYSLDLMSDLIGQKLISIGGNVALEGGRCNIGMERDFEAENRASPTHLSFANARQRSFDLLGLGRQEALQPNTLYKIIGMSKSHNIDKYSHASRDLLEVTVEKYAQGDSVSLKESLENRQVDRLKVRMYFNFDERPERDRAENFFRHRIGKSFITKAHVPTIVAPHNLNGFLSNFVSCTETARMKHGTVYVLDSVYGIDATSAHLIYHPVEVHEQVTRGDGEILLSGTTIFGLRGYKKEEVQNNWFYLKLCQIDRISVYFDRIKCCADPNKQWVFTVASDIYDGMLDYMHTPTGPTPTDLFHFDRVDIRNQAAIEKLKRESLTRTLLRTRGGRAYDRIGPTRD